MVKGCGEYFYFNMVSILLIVMNFLCGVGGVVLEILVVLISF